MADNSAADLWGNAKSALSLPKRDRAAAPAARLKVSGVIFSASPKPVKTISELLRFGSTSFMTSSKLALAPYFSNASNQNL